MSAQLLIYENAVPVSKQKHEKWSVEVKQDFQYASKLNVLPLLATEFIAAAHEYPVVFSQSEDVVQPVVLLGMKGEQNLYIGDDGKWTAKYVPAFLRRYPFVFGRTGQANQFSLCIDESFGGFDKKGKKGEKLFTKDGETTTYVNNVLKFLQVYQQDHDRTQTFCEKLKKLDLLQSQNALWTGPNGEKAALTGFSCVDREKLKALKPKELADLVSTNEMELLYAHLMSLNNLQAFKEKLALATAAS